MASVSRPVLYGGIALLGAIAWFATAPDDASGIGGSGKLNRGNSASKQVQSDITEEDYKAARNPFPRLNEGTKNAFNPLVARQEQGATGALAPNEIPASYTGGEAGWMYTGTMIVNDVPSALLENQMSGDVLYLMVGQRVKRAVIAQIAPTYIVVKGAGGQSLKLDLLADRAEPGEDTGNFGFEPVRPDVPGALRGPIRPGGSTGIADLQSSEQS